MAAPLDSASLKVQDPADIAAAMRLEYQLLRQQISDADNTCVLILGLLITASLTITGIATQRLAASVAWLLMPLWLFGYWYLTEKRFIILKTALYLRTQVEVKYPGFGWESWNQATRHVLGETKPQSLGTDRFISRAAFQVLWLLRFQSLSPIPPVGILANRGSGLRSSAQLSSS